MRRFQRILIFLMMGVMLMAGFFGCGGKPTYKVICSQGFENAKKSYVPGEEVVLYYRFFATDTDYYFYSNDVVLKKDFDYQKGYVFNFIMPEHDVLISMYTRNSMVYDPNANKEETEEDRIEAIKGCELVFDYYEATVGTVGGDSHDEFAIYRRPNGNLLLAKYSQQEGGQESCRVSILSDTVLHDCMDAVDRYNMRIWKDGIAITGEVYVVKFREADRMIRVSSDDMPEDGLTAFGEIETILAKAWKMFGPKN